MQTSLNNILKNARKNSWYYISMLKNRVIESFANSTAYLFNLKMLFPRNQTQANWFEN